MILQIVFQRKLNYIYIYIYFKKCVYMNYSFRFAIVTIFILRERNIILHLKFDF